MWGTCLGADEFFSLTNCSSRFQSTFYLSHLTELENNKCTLISRDETHLSTASISRNLENFQSQIKYEPLACIENEQNYINFRLVWYCGYKFFNILVSKKVFLKTFAFVTLFYDLYHSYINKGFTEFLQVIVLKLFKVCIDCSIENVTF